MVVHFYLASGDIWVSDFRVSCVSLLGAVLTRVVSNFPLVGDWTDNVIHSNRQKEARTWRIAAGLL